MKKIRIIVPFAILVIVIAFGTYHFLNKPEKKPPVTSEKPVAITRSPSLFTNLIQCSNPVSDYLGGDKITDMILSGKSEISGSLGLLNLKNSSSLVNKTSLDFFLAHSAPSKEVSANVRLKYNDKTALNTNAYMTNQALLFNVPTKSDTIYSMEFRNMDSAIFPTKLLNSLSGDIAELTHNTDFISAYMDTIKKTYPDKFKKITDGISQSPAEADSFSNSGVTYTISSDSVATFANCVLSISIEDEEFRKLLTPILSSYIKSNIANFISDDGIQNPDDIAHTLISNLKDITDTFASSYQDELKFTVWKNKNGQLAGLNGENKLHLNNEEITLITKIQTNNTEHNFDHVTGQISIGYNKKTFSIHFSRNLKTLEKPEISELTTSIEYSINDKHALSVEQKQKFDSSSGHYQNDILLTNEDDESLKFSVIGSFTDIQKERSFQFELNSFYINENQQNLIALSGNISVKTGESEITKMKGHTKELTYMSDEEIQKLFGLGGQK